ncbi:unnamed protein product, partial [marine sediment metagenome]
GADKVAQVYIGRRGTPQDGLGAEGNKGEVSGND